MINDNDIKDANAKLGKVSRVLIWQRGNRLWLQATLPPKPHINRIKDYQQSLSLGRNATADEAGLRFALTKARIINGQLAQGLVNSTQ